MILKIWGDAALLRSLSCLPWPAATHYSPTTLLLDDALGHAVGVGI